MTHLLHERDHESFNILVPVWHHGVIRLTTKRSQVWFPAINQSINQSTGLFIWQLKSWTETKQ